MPNYTYTRNRGWKVRKSGRAFKAVLTAGTILILLTLFVQLYVMSIFATKGDEVSKLQAQKEELVAQNKQLQQNIAETRNLDFIENRSQGIGYVDINPKEVTYLKVE